MTKCRMELKLLLKGNLWFNIRKEERLKTIQSSHELGRLKGSLRKGIIKMGTELKGKETHNRISKLKFSPLKRIIKFKKPQVED